MGSKKSIPALLSAYRWPMIIVGLLSMSIIAQGVLVYVATRPDVPRPMKNFYELSLQWDADAAELAASRDLGWHVRFELPKGTPLASNMPRPIDVHVQDRDGAPIPDLTGRLLALRPSDDRRNQEGVLTALPHIPGTYRTLIRLNDPGIWEFRLDTQRQGLRFVYLERVTLSADDVKAGTPRP